MDPKTLTILLADDDDGHATLIRRNLERARRGVRVVRLIDGPQVLEYLRQELTREWAGGPLLLLLDIRMPGMDGTEVLREIKSNPATRLLPVYMLTTTDNPAEVARCFELGCNAYLTKPVSYEDFVVSMERLCAFLEVSEMPARPPEYKHASA